jgi:hypothetical protein
MIEQRAGPPGTAQRQVMRSREASGLALLSAVGLTNAATGSSARREQHRMTYRGTSTRQSAEASIRGQTVRRDAAASRDNSAQTEQRHRLHRG